MLAWSFKMKHLPVKLRERNARCERCGAARIPTTGEGWHNNHHRYPGSASQGFFWREVDVTYYVLCLLARLGLVWDLRRVPDSVRVEPMPT